MKTLMRFSLLLTIAFLTFGCPSKNEEAAPILQTTKVNRWISPVINDFISLPESIYSDAQLTTWGYKDKIYQYNAFTEKPNGQNVTIVNRWVMPNCSESILIAEHELTDQQMESFGYKDKLFQFYAYKTPPNDGKKYKAVHRWINAKLQGDACRDFTLSVADGELTDNQLTSFGYTDKKLQFYVPE